VSEDNKTEESEKGASNVEVEEQVAPDSKQSGPTFTEAPDPLTGVKKGVSDVMASMEGKTVSMKLYIGTIIGVVILMMLARCGGQ
jgi:hypothetical protein